MPNVILNAYKTVKATVYTLAEKTEKLPLAAPETLSISPVYISDELGCELNPDAVEQSIGQSRASKFNIKIGKAALLVGVAFLLPSSLYIYFAFLEHVFTPETIEHGFDSQITDYGPKSEVNWIIPGFITIGFSALLIAGGFSVIRAENSRAHRRLTSFKHAGFKTPAMKDWYEEFRIWVDKARPKIYLAMSEGRFVTLPDQIWAYPDLPLILFGTAKQRREVVDADTFVLSDTVIEQTDWSAFLTYKKSLERSDTSSNAPATHEIKHQTLPEDKHNGSLSLRQKARGKGTNWCPRFEMMRSDEEFLKAYKARGFDLNSFTLKRQPCHRILILMNEYFEEFEFFFDKNPPDNQKEALLRLEKRVKLALGVEGQTDQSRFKQFKIKSWITLEKHIEDLGVISDEELIARNPHLQSFQDS